MAQINISLQSLIPFLTQPFIQHGTSVKHLASFYLNFQSNELCIRWQNGCDLSHKICRSVCSTVLLAFTHISHWFSKIRECTKVAEMCISQPLEEWISTDLLFLRLNSIFERRFNCGMPSIFRQIKQNRIEIIEFLAARCKNRRKTNKTADKISKINWMFASSSLKFNCKCLLTFIIFIVILLSIVDYFNISSWMRLFGQIKINNCQIKLELAQLALIILYAWILNIFVVWNAKC